MAKGTEATRDSVLTESFQAQKLQPVGMHLPGQQFGRTLADPFRPVTAREAPVGGPWDPLRLRRLDQRHGVAVVSAAVGGSGPSEIPAAIEAEIPLTSRAHHSLGDHVFQPVPESVTRGAGIGAGRQAGVGHCCPLLTRRKAKWASGPSSQLATGAQQRRLWSTSVNQRRLLSQSGQRDSNS